ncbi:MAG: acyl-CoA desaturase [Actinobacteria bacterium]|nr:acyl-CoA desaturase [Actinomycetota bacterium]
MPTVKPTEYAHLSDEQVAELGRELDAIRQRVLDERGAVDADYIRRIVRIQRRLELAGRGLLFASFLPPAWLAGTVALGIAKILDNMEIGHNVMHGQYDFMGDPSLSSQQFEWDTAAPSANWKRSHNVQHHTWTNVVGRDRDIGYGILRMNEDQPWRPAHLLNPVNAIGLGLFFQWGVALHDLEVEKLRSGETPWEDVAEFATLIRRKAAQQARKDYLLFPLLAFPIAPLVFAGNVTANLIRNVWAFSIIFCGHFPDGVALFSEEDIEDETRGEWYLRQMLGSANITGGRLFHVMSGNLSHQIEHHLFPDLPARRYADIAVEVREICERYGLPYTTGRFSKQLFSVARRIVRLALPDRFRKRPDRPTSLPVAPRDEHLLAA